MPDSLTPILLLVHAGASCFMAGVIWFVQVVHYPLMDRVPQDRVQDFAIDHQRRTTWVVAPAMLVEAATSVLLVASPGVGTARSPLAWAGLVLLGVVWVVTFGLMVPLHARLARGDAAGVVCRLVRVNWARTLAWSARGVLGVMLLLGG